MEDAKDQSDQNAEGKEVVGAETRARYLNSLANGEGGGFEKR